MTLWLETQLLTFCWQILGRVPKWKQPSWPARPSSPPSFLPSFLSLPVSFSFASVSLFSSLFRQSTLSPLNPFPKCYFEESYALTQPRVLTKADSPMSFPRVNTNPSLVLGHLSKPCQNPGTVGPVVVFFYRGISIRKDRYGQLLSFLDFWDVFHTS